MTTLKRKKYYKEYYKKNSKKIQKKRAETLKKKIINEYLNDRYYEDLNENND